MVQAVESAERLALGSGETHGHDAGPGHPGPGKYVVVWKKQPSGQWKAIVDVFNTDQ